MTDIIKSIEIAVAGKHNLLITGEHGCGKTYLIENLIPRLTPPMSDSEYEETKGIYKIVFGESHDKAINTFRMPHYSSTLQGLLGGGSKCHPGEVSLAHNGQLFLDDTIKFRSSMLQALRTPLTQKQIRLARSREITTYPANFQLILGLLPSFSGLYMSDKYYPDSMESIIAYWHKIDKPVLDKIEIKLFMEKERIDLDSLPLEDIKGRINTAISIQRNRGLYNSHLSDEQVIELVNKSNLSIPLNNTESFNLFRVALTVANMRGSENITMEDVNQALDLSINRKMRTILKTVFEQ